MNTTWQALLWKEWRERRWMVVPLTIGAAGLMPLMLGPAYPEPYMAVLGPTLALSFCALPMASLFLGGSIAAGENSHRTMGFLQALPSGMSLAALMKLAVSLLIIWLPCTAFLISVWLGPWPFRVSVNGVFSSVLVYGLACTSFMIWVAAFGANLRDEIRAGAVGLLAVLGIMAIAVVIVRLTGLDEYSLAGKLLPAAHPVGLTLVGLDAGLDGWRGLGLSAHLLLVIAYLMRFGRVVPASRPVESRDCPKVVTASLAPPRRSAMRSILWKQMRETWPLAALGAGAILAITIALSAAVDRGRESLAGVLPVILTGTWSMTGFLVAVVAGIGVFMDDLRPELHTFWRSRPVNADQWFALKFFPALAATILTMALPVLVVLLVLAALGVSAVFGREGQSIGLLVLAGYGVIAQSAAFCIAATAMALLRRPVVAAVATIVAAVVLSIAAGELSDTMSPPLLAWLLGSAAAVPTTVLAWLAIRYDWGWKA